MGARSVRGEYSVGVVVARWRTPTKLRQRGHDGIGVRADVGLFAGAPARRAWRLVWSCCPPRAIMMWTVGQRDDVDRSRRVSA